VAKRVRGFESLGDMVRSLGLVLVVVAVILLLIWRPKPDAVKPVDPAPPLAQARQSAPYEVYAPEPAPRRWVPTVARYDPAPPANVWTLGYVTTSDEYAAVAQTDSDPEALLDEVAPDATQAGESTVNGQIYQRWEDPGQSRRALAAAVTGSTLVVGGTAGWAELERLAASLRAG
jgi:Protein of unknown function (DUF4245)